MLGQRPCLGLGETPMKASTFAPIRQRRIVGQLITFIESSVFQRLLPLYLDDDEYAELQQHLMLCPMAGELVPGSGGIRKLRWLRPGMGERGGLRED